VGCPGVEFEVVVHRYCFLPRLWDECDSDLYFELSPPKTIL
jgi:hypothetical protein